MIAKWSRPWFGLTALVVLAGLVIQGFESHRLVGGHFHGGAAVLNMFSFFTIESNILLMVTCALLAWRRTGWGVVFSAFRMAGFVGIVITGIVYYAVLRGLLELHGWSYVADLILHTISPLMAVYGWVVFGPRGYAGSTATRLSVIYPAVYLVFTLIRGPIVKWYPYPFVDVITHGYPTVFFNAVLVAVLFFAVAGGASWLDRKLPA